MHVTWDSLLPDFRDISCLSCETLQMLTPNVVGRHFRCSSDIRAWALKNWYMQQHEINVVIEFLFYLQVHVNALISKLQSIYRGTRIQNS